MSYLKFDKTLMTNLEEALPREILRTNRSGAYHCTTIVDCNTRKYHGLLVIPVPELDDENHVLLSSLDETVIQHGAEFNLGLHKYQGDNYSPKGHKYIREFECEKVPTTIYRVGGVILKKEKLFVHHENRILIRYTLLDAHSATTLRLRPFLAFRSVREYTHENAQANREYQVVSNGIKTYMCQGSTITGCRSMAKHWKRKAGRATAVTSGSSRKRRMRVSALNQQAVTVIDEAALYKLAFRSNKPQADTFVNWVAGVVLPQIRQTGQYRIKGETECMREQQQRKRLPLPKYRPFFEEWKQRVKFYISREELAEVAGFYNVTNAHVFKVYNGRTASRPIVEGITRIAKRNRRQNIIYPDPVPICEQMVIDWDNEDNK